MLREGCSQCCIRVAPTCWATASGYSHDLLAQRHCSYHPAPFELLERPVLHSYPSPAVQHIPGRAKHMPRGKPMFHSRAHLPLDMEPSAQSKTLKRSNAITAKLRDEKVSSVSSDEWAAGNVKLSKALKYARKQDEKAAKRQDKKLEKASRQDSFQPSISDGTSGDMAYHALPVGSCAATQSKNPSSTGWSRSGVSGSPVAAVPVETKKRRWGILGQKKEDSQRPVDNFTKWDGDGRARRTYAASGSAGPMAGTVLGLASPPHEPAGVQDEQVDSDHIEDVQELRTSQGRNSPAKDHLKEALADNERLLARLEQVIDPEVVRKQRQSLDNLQHRRQGRLARADAPLRCPEAPKARDQGRVQPVSISDIDWSRADSDLQLEMLLEQLENDRRSDASPTDRGIGMDDEKLPMNKGKGRALSVSSSGTSRSVLTVMSVQEMLRYPEDPELNKKHALAQVVELEYRKARQEEEDARRAWGLQEEERIAREYQEEEERIAAELASRRECVCCGDEKHVLDFPARPATDKCEHGSTTCMDCMHSWLASELDSKGCQGLKCAECPSTLEYDAMQLLSDEATFTKYEQLLLRNTLSSLPEFAWCLSPICTSGQLNIQNGNYMECDTSLGGCGYKQCLLHKTPWHAGETCPAYDHRVTGRKAAEDEAATQAILDEVSKICPGESCGWRIQKSDGCDHMTCRKCQWQFCWECLASHRQIREEGNTAHERWCKFHSENLDKEGNGGNGSNGNGVVQVGWPFNAHA